MSLGVGQLRRLRPMRTYVRARGGHDPARRRRRLLRLGRAAGRPEPARAAGGRRAGRRDGRELRGQGLRRSRRHAHQAGPPPLSGHRGRPLPVRRLRGRQPGALRGLQAHRAGGRGPFDGGGVSRRSRARPHPGLAARGRVSLARGGPRRGRPRRLGRPRDVEGRGEDGLGGGEAGRVPPRGRRARNGRFFIRSRSNASGASARPPRRGCARTASPPSGTSPRSARTRSRPSSAGPTGRGCTRSRPAAGLGPSAPGARAARSAPSARLACGATRAATSSAHWMPSSTG